MIKMGKSRVCVGLSLMILGCMVAGSASAGLFGWKIRSRSKTATKAVSKAPKRIVQKSLIVFPLDGGGTSIPKGLGGDVAAAIRSSLSGERQYSPLLYSDRLAPIQRARTESDSGMYSTQETTIKFSENRDKALIAARILAADYCLVGFIDECKIVNKLAEITASVDLVDTKTGKLIKTMLVQGRTPENSTVADDDEARALAAGDVVAKIKSQLLDYDQSPPTATENKPAEKAVKKDAVPAPTATVDPAAAASKPAAEAPAPAAADDSESSTPPTP